MLSEEELFLLSKIIKKHECEKDGMMFVSFEPNRIWSVLTSKEQQLLLNIWEFEVKKC